jgi:hypothetical protein
MSNFYDRTSLRTDKHRAVQIVRTKSVPVHVAALSGPPRDRLDDYSRRANKGWLTRASKSLIGPPYCLRVAGPC